MIDTCLAAGGDYRRALAYFTHLLPAGIILVYSFVILFRTKYSDISCAYFFFGLTIVFWLLGDFVAWGIFSNYEYIQAFWSWLDYADMLFFIFAVIFSKLLFGSRLTNLEKGVFFLMLLVPYAYTFSGNAVTDFAVRDCEVLENDFLTTVKFFLQIVCALYIYGVYILSRIKGNQPKSSWVSLIAITAFLLVFTVTEYIASTTEVYEYSLYSLLILPFSFIALSHTIIYSTGRDARFLGIQLLIYVFFVVSASQLLTIVTTADLFLSIGSTLITLFISVLFLNSVSQERKILIQLNETSEKLVISNERLKELDKQKSEFISIASHQLRTPLTAIKGYVSLLLEGSYGVMNKDVNDVLNKVYSVNDRLAHLVEDLLNVSRIEAGRIQYNFQPTQLADILTELHDMFMMPAKSKGLQFNLSLPKEMLPLIMADPNKIKEISSNLIDNAIKYTPTGSVTVSLEKAGENARIAISDTGIGIKPEDKDNLFSKFVRSEETSRMVVGGAGLGLFVGKSFVAAHGGKIWAESEGTGKGSQFIIELPIVNPALQAGTIDKKQEG